jgi:hypothetical protein
VNYCLSSFSFEQDIENLKFRGGVSQIVLGEYQQ